MNCPFCQSPMISGYLQSGREVYFTETPHKLLFSRKDGEIVLTRNNKTSPTCEAFCCPACRKVIAAYE